jgi:Mrp family chromosome partitioning ATPase
MCVEQDDPWKVHFILNSKGGVGKSFIAFLLAQYYRQRQAPVVCFDADETTATFSSFAALNVTRIELMQGPRIDERRFDLILEKVLTDDAHAVIDTGTSPGRSARSRHERQSSYAAPVKSGRQVGPSLIASGRRRAGMHR